MARATWGSTDLGGTIGTLDTAAKLRVAHWPGKADGPGTVILVQGRAEFIECYGETIADLKRRGFAVVAFDLRGQGGSQRRTSRGGHIDSFRQYGDDIAAVVRHASALGLPRPFTVLGHSMGGLAALLAQPQLARQVDRMVLLAPMLDITDLPLPRPLITLIAAGACLVGLSRLPATAPPPPASPKRFSRNNLTSDPERYARICALVEANPDLLTGAPTFGWIRAALRATARARRLKGRPLAVPTLFVACAADKVVSTAAIDGFARAAPGGGLVLLRGARHQILFERDELRSLFFAAFEAFLSSPSTRDTAARPKRTARAPKFVVGEAGEPSRVYEGWKVDVAAASIVEPVAPTFLVTRPDGTVEFTRTLPGQATSLPDATHPRAGHETKPPGLDAQDDGTPKAPDAPAPLPEAAPLPVAAPEHGETRPVAAKTETGAGADGGTPDHPEPPIRTTEGTDDIAQAPPDRAAVRPAPPPATTDAEARQDDSARETGTQAPSPTAVVTPEVADAAEKHADAAPGDIVATAETGARPPEDSGPQIDPRHEAGTPAHAIRATAEIGDAPPDHRATGSGATATTGPDARLGRDNLHEAGERVGPHAPSEPVDGSSRQRAPTHDATEERASAVDVPTGGADDDVHTSPAANEDAHAKTAAEAPPVEAPEPDAGTLRDVPARQEDAAMRTVPHESAAAVGARPADERLAEDAGPPAPAGDDADAFESAPEVVTASQIEQMSAGMSEGEASWLATTESDIDVATAGFTDPPYWTVHQSANTAPSSPPDDTPPGEPWPADVGEGHGRQGQDRNRPDARRDALPDDPAAPYDDEAPEAPRRRNRDERLGRRRRLAAGEDWSQDNTTGAGSVEGSRETGGRDAEGGETAGRRRRLGPRRRRARQEENAQYGDGALARSAGSDDAGETVGRRSGRQHRRRPGENGEAETIPLAEGTGREGGAGRIPGARRGRRDRELAEGGEDLPTAARPRDAAQADMDERRRERRRANPDEEAAGLAPEGMRRRRGQREAAEFDPAQEYARRHAGREPTREETGRDEVVPSPHPRRLLRRKLRGERRRRNAQEDAPVPPAEETIAPNEDHPTPPPASNGVAPPPAGEINWTASGPGEKTGDDNRNERIVEALAERIREGDKTPSSGAFGELVSSPARSAPSPASDTHDDPSGHRRR